MHQVNRYLLGIFILILLVTIGEIIYYFMYITPQKQYKTLDNITPPSSNQVMQTPFSSSNQAQAIDPSVIDNLKAFKKDILVSSILENTYKGKVTQVETKENTVQFTGDQGQVRNFAYKYLLKIQNADNLESTFYFRESDMQNTVIKSSQEGSSRLSFQDLKVGDQVTIIEKMDLLKKWEESFIGYNITKE